MRDEQDAIYLQGRWRAAFAEVEGDQIKRLYAAGAMGTTGPSYARCCG